MTKKLDKNPIKKDEALKIEGTFDDVLRVSVKKDEKEATKTDKDS